MDNSISIKKNQIVSKTAIHRNVNRLFDTKGRNRISGKPLITGDSGTLGVAGIPCLFLGLCQGSVEAVVTSLTPHPSKPYVWPFWKLEKKRLL